MLIKVKCLYFLDVCLEFDEYDHSVLTSRCHVTTRKLEFTLGLDPLTDSLKGANVFDKWVGLRLLELDLYLLTLASCDRALVIF